MLGSRPSAPPRRGRLPPDHDAPLHSREPVREEDSTSRRQPLPFEPLTWGGLGSIRRPWMAKVLNVGVFGEPEEITMENRTVVVDKYRGTPVGEVENVGRKGVEGAIGRAFGSIPALRRMGAHHRRDV